jgi:hypothetical protein
MLRRVSQRNDIELPISPKFSLSPAFLKSTHNVTPVKSSRDPLKGSRDRWQCKQQCRGVNHPNFSIYHPYKPNYTRSLRMDVYP